MARGHRTLSGTPHRRRRQQASQGFIVMINDVQLTAEFIQHIHELRPHAPLRRHQQQLHHRPTEPRLHALVLRAG